MKTFSFNLIPQKEKKLVVKEEKRDEVSVYTAFFPFIAVLVWLGLTLFNGLVVNQTKLNWEQSNLNKQNKIDTEFIDIRTQHGELVVKTNILTDLVQKDIKPEVLFILAEKIFPVSEKDVLIIGYGRNEDGTFNINLSTSTYKKFAEIARRFSNYEGSDNVLIQNVSYNSETNQVQGTINFFLDIEYIENG